MAGHLVPPGSMLAFLAEHRRELFCARARSTAAAPVDAGATSATKAGVSPEKLLTLAA